MEKYPVFTVFYSKEKSGEDVLDIDFFSLEEAIDFFDSVSTEFKQINRYDSYDSSTKVLIQTAAWAEA